MEFRALNGEGDVEHTGVYLLRYVEYLQRGTRLFLEHNYLKEHTLYLV